MRVVERFEHQVRVLEHVEIPMSDGTRLAARVWLPERAATDPVPAVFEYIPYRHRDMTRSRDSVNAPYMAGHGYAYLRVDIRGCGNSEGYIVDQYSEPELADGVEVIAWIARQDWCDGHVAMMGLSWGGFNALQIAARQPPALDAIVTVCSTDDTYGDNMHYMGGCLLGDNLSEATTMFAYQSLPPDPTVVGDRWRAMWMERLEHCDPWLLPWLEHQWRDEYWRPTSVCEDYSKIRCPVMAVSGWSDGFTNAVFRLMQHLDVPRMGLVGPWSHMYPHVGVPGPAIGFLQEVRRWLDRWLRGIESGVEKEPLVRVWMQDSVSPQFSAHAERPGRWVAERSWPSPRVETRRLALRERHISWSPDPADPKTRSRSVRSPLTTGLFAGKWCAYAAAPDHPGDQRREDGGAIVFETLPLTEPVEILGSPVVELEMEADRPVAQVAARLCDVLPDGPVTRVTYGLLNLTHREGHAEPQVLVPNERVKVRVTLNAVAQRFPAGNRIRLSLSTSYWPLAWPSPEMPMITVHPAGSALYLPIRPPQSDDDALRPFEEAEGGPPTPPRRLSPGKVNWRVIRDLAEDTATLEVVRHDDHFYLEDIDLEVEKYTTELYSSGSNDIRTARGETRTERAFARGGWRTRIQTRTVLTADSRSFRVHANLDAYEGEERIVAETWTRQIERKLV